jgi:hypothetical protein
MRCMSLKIWRRSLQALLVPAAEVHAGHLCCVQRPVLTATHAQHTCREAAAEQAKKLTTLWLVVACGDYVIYIK